MLNEINLNCDENALPVRDFYSCSSFNHSKCLFYRLYATAEGQTYYTFIHNIIRCFEMFSLGFALR